MEADGGGADQGEPVSLLGLFGGRKRACAQRGDRNTPGARTVFTVAIEQNHRGLLLTVLIVAAGVEKRVCVCL